MHAKSSGARAARNRDPAVILDVRFERGLLYMSVKNIGDDPVYDVSVEFDKAIRGIGGKRVISDLPLFRELSFLAPQKEIETFLDSSGAYFARDEPKRFTARISYQDSEGKRHQTKITHNLEIYEDIGYVGFASDDAPDE